MKSLSESEVYSRLDSALPTWRDSGGWTYNEFCKGPDIYLSEDIPLEKLIETTLCCLRNLRLPGQELLLYHDGMAGWKSAPKEIRGFIIEDIEELRTVIPEQAFFRDPKGYSDNYNLIDTSGQWMITFCHEDDWICFHRSEAEINALKAKCG
jgi:hypothetical protein